MNWYIGVLKKYAVFKGRARRKEFWYFCLFSLIVSIILVIFDKLVGTYRDEYGIGLFSGLYQFAVIIPGMAVSTRRLHDTDRSGWWQLIVLIPIVGAIVFLVFASLNSKPGNNRFGSNPKGVST